MTNGQDTVTTVAEMIGEADPKRRWSACVKLAQQIVDVVNPTPPVAPSGPSEGQTMADFIEAENRRARIILAKAAIANCATAYRDAIKRGQVLLDKAGDIDGFGELGALLHFIDEYEAITKEKDE